MKSGRPSYHIKARWISCVDPSTKEASLYKLDDKGCIVKTKGGIVPQKVIYLEVNFDPPDPLANDKKVIESDAAVLDSVKETKNLPIPEIEGDDIFMIDDLYNGLEYGLIDF
jgi:hypothetical protein